MNVLIAVATELEAAVFFKHKKCVKSFFYNRLIYSFKERSNTFDVYITGIGMVATTYSLQLLLLKKKYELVLNIGIAGVFTTSNLQITQLVYVTRDYFSECGAEDGDQFIKADELFANLEPNYKQSTFKVQTASYPAYTICKLPNVTGITVNTIHGNTKNIDKVISLFSPDVESMEGAAVLYVCNQLNIQVAQIRAISNFVSIRNTKEWKISQALSNLQKFLFDEFIPKL